jgi:hypothetical protein
MPTATFPIPSAYQSFCLVFNETFFCQFSLEKKDSNWLTKEISVFVPLPPMVSMTKRRKLRKIPTRKTRWIASWLFLHSDKICLLTRCRRRVKCHKHDDDVCLHGTRSVELRYLSLSFRIINYHLKCFFVEAFEAYAKSTYDYVPRMSKRRENSSELNAREGGEVLHIYPSI